MVSNTRCNSWGLTKASEKDAFFMPIFVSEDRTFKKNFTISFKGLTHLDQYSKILNSTVGLT